MRKVLSKPQSSFCITAHLHSFSFWKAISITVLIRAESEQMWSYECLCVTVDSELLRRMFASLRMSCWGLICKTAFEIKKNACKGITPLPPRERPPRKALSGMALIASWGTNRTHVPIYNSLNLKCIVARNNTEVVQYNIYTDKRHIKI